MSDSFAFASSSTASFKLSLILPRTPLAPSLLRAAWSTSSTCAKPAAAPMLLPLARCGAALMNFSGNAFRLALSSVFAVSFSLSSFHFLMLKYATTMVKTTVKNQNTFSVVCRFSLLKFMVHNTKPAKGPPPRSSSAVGSSLRLSKSRPTASTARDTWPKPSKMPASVESARLCERNLGPCEARSRDDKPARGRAPEKARGVKATPTSARLVVSSAAPRPLRRPGAICCLAHTCCAPGLVRAHASTRLHACDGPPTATARVEQIETVCIMSRGRT
mmetsp:Transcript_65232/g.165344  ORF Transcript_65232/g.165344 Transcript_65232/m.165344 type:complete len:275 (+) Transcript_65232:192-1016(+)